MSAPPPSEVAPTWSKAVPVEVSTRLVLSLSGINLCLRPGSNQEQVDIRARVPECSPGRAREILNRQGLQTHRSEECLKIFCESPPTTPETWRRHRTHSPTIHLDLEIPSWLAVEVESAGGRVDAAGLGGALDLTTHGGSVQVQETEGPLVVSGNSSAIRVRRVTVPRLTVQVAAGTFQMEQSTAGSIAVESRGAPVTLTEVTGQSEITAHGTPLTLDALSGPCSAQVRGGSLTFSGAPEHETALTVVGGSLRTSLPPSHAVDLTAQGADVSLDDAFPFAGKHTAQYVDGTVNGGGPPIWLRAIDGRVQCTA